MNPALRAKMLLVDPLLAWAAIDKEPGDVAYILSRYVAVLAAIPALFSFIGACFVGVLAPDGHTVFALYSDGLFGAILGYVLTCVTVLVLAALIDLLTPLVGGRRDFDRAFRLAAYSFTPVWLAGIFLILPGLRFLTLTGCYGAYILWLGAPRLMRMPEQKSLLLTAVVAVCAFALLYAAAIAQRVVFGTPGL